MHTELWRTYSDSSLNILVRNVEITPNVKTIIFFVEGEYCPGLLSWYTVYTGNNSLRLINNTFI